MSNLQQLAERLETLEPSSAVSVRMSIDSYLDVIRSVVENFAPGHDVDVIYVSASLPSESLIQVLTVLEVNMDRVFFVDCISHIMMGASLRNPKVIYVESPTMLETLMLKVEYLMRKLPDKKKLVIIDSINTLSIHNDTKILSEFFHILVNNLRSREAYTLIYDTDETQNEEIANMMGLVCDSVLDLHPGGENQ